jgi:hypothetical protein
MPPPFWGFRSPKVCAPERRAHACEPLVTDACERLHTPWRHKRRTARPRSTAWKWRQASRKLTPLAGLFAGFAVYQELALKQPLQAQMQAQTLTLQSQMQAQTQTLQTIVTMLD